MSWLERKVVLVPFDFSSESRGAVDIGMKAVASPSGLHILHVLPLLTPTEPALAYYDLPNDQSRREATEKALRELFGEDKFRAVQLAVVFGDPGQKIVNHAEQIKAELIVLPSPRPDWLEALANWIRGGASLQTGSLSRAGIKKMIPSVR